MDFKNFLGKYDYSYPRSLIALEPASPRDSARLMIFNRAAGRAAYDKFYNLGKYLPPRAVLVLNDTKVIPARFDVEKETGGKATCLFLGKRKNLAKVISNKNLRIDSTLSGPKDIKFKVERQDKNVYYLKVFGATDFKQFLIEFGRTPTPPYIKNPALSEKELRKKYQTVFANKFKEKSVAAPTASLHFTKKLLNKLEKTGFKAEYLTLDVNLGTFAPLEESQVSNGKLHAENYSIRKKVLDRLNDYKKQKRPIIAVGTTVTRALESSANGNGILTQSRRETDLFIREGYKFKFVDGLITNFHVPQSSLLILVSAFAGRKKILGLYDEAVRNNFRLFSFGDGMLIY